MKSDKLQDAIGNIREEYIEEAHADAPAQIRVESIKTAQKDAAKRRRRVLRTALPLAACLLLAVGIVSGGLGDLRNLISGAKKSEPMESIGKDQISVEQESKSENISQKPGTDAQPQYGEASEIKEGSFSVFYDQFNDELDLISPEEALQQLLSGVYFSNPEGLQLSGSESFPAPELKFLSFDGSDNFLPYYVFMPEDAAESCFYVPALLSATPRQ